MVQKSHIDLHHIGDCLDIIRHAILVIDTQQRITVANQCAAKMFRTSEEALQGMLIEQIFMPEDRDILKSNILNLTQANHEFEGEVMFKRLDNTRFPGFLATSLFTWSHQGEGMAFTIHDISELKTMENALHHAERATFLGRLTEDISHQVRNPVMVIGGFTRRLHAQYPHDDKIALILREAMRLESLLTAIGDFIKMPHPELKQTHWSTLIMTIEQQGQSLVTAQNHRWQMTYDQALTNDHFLVDETLLLLALNAIINNSCQAYSPHDKGFVSLSIQPSNDALLPYTIEVKDQGIGISPENLPHIFSHFYTNKTNHAGMGLTVAQRAIEEQNGKITVTSIRGQGTNVTLQLRGERRRKIRTTKLSWNN